MERKHFPFAVKQADALLEGVIEGYAAVFGNVDDGDDVIDPGAFAKTIQESGSRIKMGWQHEAPFGVTRSIREVAAAELPPEVLSRAPGATGGLYVVGQADGTGEDLDRLRRLASGSVDELSIGFQVVKAQWDKVDDRPVRRLKELRLFEWSPVWVAMNPAALITGIKAEGGDEVDRLLAAITEFKEGRVLSASSRSKIDSALEAARGLIAELEALLEAAEPAKDHSALPPASTIAPARLDVRLRLAQADLDGLTQRLRAVGLSTRE